MINLLIGCHAFNACRFFISIFLNQMRAVDNTKSFIADFGDRILSFFGIVLSIWSVLVCHDFYFFTDFSLDCTQSQIGLTRGWAFLEIMIFYFTFAGNALFILISYIFLKDSGLRKLETEDHRIDFLQKYALMNGLYQTYFLLFTTTIFALVA